MPRAISPHIVFRAAHNRPAKVEGDRNPISCVFVPAGENYFLYQKIATAISTTVIIHRTMSLLLFFSSAIKEVQHTRIHSSSPALNFCTPL